jgi:hypothetical protein
LALLTLLGFAAANDARADLAKYVSVVGAGTPATYLATNLAPVPTIVDIGAVSGDITYEFIVNGDPPTASSALMGSLAGGQGEAIKFEQWNKTGHYGATKFGVADYEFNANTAFGTDVALDFVVNSAVGTTALFVNGADTGATIASPLTLHGSVGIGGADAFGSGWFDVFSGTVKAVAVFDSALTPAEISEHASAFFEVVPEPSGALLLMVGAAGAACRRSSRQRRR